MRRRQGGVKPPYTYPPWAHTMNQSVPSVFRGWKSLFLLSFACVVVASGCSRRERGTPSDPSSGATDVADVVRGLVEAEDLLLELTPKLKGLNRSANNLRVPDHQSISLFADSVRLVDVEPRAETPLGEIPGVGITRYDVPVREQEAEFARDDLAIWRDLFRDVRYFENTKFYLVKGDFAPGDHTRYITQIGFSALGRSTDGNWLAMHADQEVEWKRSVGEASEITWKIDRWTTRHADVGMSSHLLFRESLRDVLTDRDTVIRARRSVHEKKLVELYRDGSTSLRRPEYKEFFAPDALGQHPSLSVADVDQDGHDDIYIMDRWAKNQLLRARGDGTFEEVAEPLGLDLPGVTTGAVFADFDNDGDLDAMVARSLESSVYLRNEDGKFVDRSDQVAARMPFFATSVSTADYNGDGLLDVYFSTYAIPRREIRDVNSAKRFFDADEAEELFRRGDQRRSEVSSFADSVGPRNLLLVNRGAGRFERAPETVGFDPWTNTFQATWADFDNDGDPDLYLANDYAPDLLYRNVDGDHFEEVSSEFGGDAMRGFGMGATFADYDNDGKQDLYVSNMFSKAGTRIAARIPSLDFRLRMAAQGNLLFRNAGDRFDLVSGLAPPSMEVAKAGWSWGGMFNDFDADGYLDLYVSSGFYTAPKEIASELDL